MGVGSARTGTPSRQGSSSPVLDARLSSSSRPCAAPPAKQSSGPQRVPQRSPVKPPHHLNRPWNSVSGTGAGRERAGQPGRATSSRNCDRWSIASASATPAEPAARPHSRRAPLQARESAGQPAAPPWASASTTSSSSECSFSTPWPSCMTSACWHRVRVSNGRLPRRAPLPAHALPRGAGCHRVVFVSVLPFAPAVGFSRVASAEQVEADDSGPNWKRQVGELLAYARLFQCEAMRQPRPQARCPCGREGVAW